MMNYQYLIVGGGMTGAAAVGFHKPGDVETRLEYYVGQVGR